MIEGDSNVIENKDIADGIKYYRGNSKTNNYDHLDLLTGYKANNGDIVIELFDLHDGKSIKKWIPDIGKIAKLTKDGNKFLASYNAPNSIVHPLMLKDSSVIFGTWQSAVKINSNSEIDWLISDYKSGNAIEKDYDNNVWLCGIRHFTKIKRLLKDNLIEKEKSHFADDVMMKINPEDGTILFEKSIIALLMENNLEHLIYGNGYFGLDSVHLNDIQPVLSDGAYWKKGDLLLSLRHISTVLLYRPSENKVLWYKQEPWLNQHNADFMDNTKISVFGNQVFRGDEENIAQSKYLKNPSKFNSVFVYNFSNDSISEPYKLFMES